MGGKFSEAGAAKPGLKGASGGPRWRGVSLFWWALGGIALTFAVLIALFFGAYYFFGGLTVADVKEMEPWPGRDVSPEQAARVDLTHLGLRIGRVQDARSDGTWGQGLYEKGIMITYQAGAKDVVTVWALRYAEGKTGYDDFLSAEDWADEKCKSRSTLHLLQSGSLDCSLEDAHDRTLFNGPWIVGITARAGTESSSRALADEVRKAIAAHWKVLAGPGK